MTTPGTLDDPRSAAPSVARTEPTNYELSDAANTERFAIGGVTFEPTHSQDLDVNAGYGAIRVIRPSEGPGITDYVTHQADFEYSTFGIHVGQDDRLTFFGSGQWIRAHLIDCRAGSPTAGQRSHHWLPCFACSGADHPGRGRAHFRRALRRGDT